MPPNRACQVSGGRYGKISATALAWSKPTAGGQPEQRPPPSAAFPATTPASNHRRRSSSVVCTKTPRKMLYNNQDSEPAQTLLAHPRVSCPHRRGETCPWLPG